MKWRSPIEALFALLFAVCVFLALLLLTGCANGNAPPVKQRSGAVSALAVRYFATSRVRICASQDTGTARLTPAPCPCAVVAMPTSLP